MLLFKEKEKIMPIDFNSHVNFLNTYNKPVQSNLVQQTHISSQPVKDTFTKSVQTSDKSVGKDFEGLKLNASLSAPLKKQVRKLFCIQLQTKTEQVLICQHSGLQLLL